MQELPIEALSKSIRDAIVITCDLGFRYLWVGALCIVQDDVDDKISEINNMGLVYRKATLTIAVAYSDSASEGFLTDWPLFQPLGFSFFLLLAISEISGSSNAPK